MSEEKAPPIQNNVLIDRNWLKFAKRFDLPYIGKPGCEGIHTLELVIARDGKIHWRGYKDPPKEPELAAGVTVEDKV